MVTADCFGIYEFEAANLKIRNFILKNAA